MENNSIKTKAPKSLSGQAFPGVGGGQTSHSNCLRHVSDLEFLHPCTFGGNNNFLRHPEEWMCCIGEKELCSGSHKKILKSVQITHFCGIPYFRMTINPCHPELVSGSLRKFVDFRHACHGSRGNFFEISPVPSPGEGEVV